MLQTLFVGILVLILLGVVLESSPVLSNISTDISNIVKLGLSGFNGGKLQ